MIPESLSKQEVQVAIMIALRESPRKKQPNAGMEMADNILSEVLGHNYGRRKQYWFYEGRAEDIIYAGFNHKSFYIRAEINYGGDFIKYRLLESRNLKQSGNSIHKNAIAWLQ